MKSAETVLAAMPGQDLIVQIAFMLECAVEHSSDPYAWGVPDLDRKHEAEKQDNQETVEMRWSEFYYAYSHVSFVCACLWSQHINDSVDAELFTDLMMNARPNMLEAVRELLFDGKGNYLDVGP